MIAGALLLLLGIGFVLVVLVAWLLRMQTGRLLKRLRAATPTTCAELLSGARLPTSVLLTGVTAAGPEGLLSSPAFGTTCLWFRTDVIVVSTEDPAPADVVRHRARAVYRRSSTGPIRIVDHTGSVLLDLKLVLQKGEADKNIAGRRVEDGTMSRARGNALGPGIGRLEAAGSLLFRASGTLSKRELDLREEFIEPERKVTVLAQPRHAAGGAVILGRRGAISDHEPAAWIEAVEADRAADRVILVLLPWAAVSLLLGVALIYLGA